MNKRSHYTKYGKPKISHPTRYEADKHVEALRLKHPGNLMDIYECYCKSWHVGHEKLPRPDRRMEMLVGQLIGVLRGTR